MRISLVLFAALSLVACREPEEEPEVEADVDGDGFGENTDCDDNDATINPDADELCDGVDQNCNRVVDEDAIDGSVFYIDSDDDGYGGSASQTACEVPAGFVANSDDCNDGDDAFHPGASEDDCSDDQDYNCDGSVGFEDADGDGSPACQDCDDSSASISPDADEVCDGKDNNCDGDIDEAGADGEETFYADDDADGFGDLGDGTAACEQPDGTVTNGDDCNDAAAEAFPGAVEVCDGLDTDCNGKVDDAPGAPLFYGDGDDDGFGNASIKVQACNAPVGFVDNKDDCDDTDEDVNPDATEVCDEQDNNCDDTVDEADDADGDGSNACDDCNDNNADVNPSAAEVCNDTDDNCNDLVDENVANPTTWYIDQDGDSFGSDAFTVKICDGPNGFVTNKDDCDDTDAEYNPGAELGCDGEDYDCDGTVDNDGDGDSYSAISCGGRDCNDDDAGVKPEQGGGCAIGLDCADIQGTSADNGEGAYSIDPDGFEQGVAPYDVYCDMSIEGGGWVLAMQASSQVNNDAILGWSSGLWENDTVLNETAPDSLSNINAKYDTFNSFESQEGLIMLVDSETDKYSVLAVPALEGTTLLDVFQNTDKTNLTWVAGETSPQEMMGYAKPTKMCLGDDSLWMINALSSHSGVRIGNDVASNDQTTDDQSSWRCYDAARMNLSYSGLGGTLESGRQYQDGWGSESLNRYRSNGGRGQGSHNGVSVFVK